MWRVKKSRLNYKYKLGTHSIFALRSCAQKERAQRFGGSDRRDETDFVYQDDRPVLIVCKEIPYIRLGANADWFDVHTEVLNSDLIYGYAMPKSDEIPSGIVDEQISSWESFVAHY